MQPLISAAMAAVFSLGGVPVQLSGVTSVLPKQPALEHPEVLWSTNQIMPATSILMQDETRWVVKTKQRLSSGIRIILVPPASPQTQLGVTVGLDAADSPIWWVGEVVEQGPVNDPGDTGTSDPTNPDGEVPTPPPTDPTEPPTDGSTPPGEGG